MGLVSNWLESRILELSVWGHYEINEKVGRTINVCGGYRSYPHY